MVEAFHQALVTSPLLRAARMQLRARTAALAYARTGHFPRLTLDGMIGRAHWTGQSFLFPRFPTLSANQYSYGVTLTQPIYHGGEVRAAVRAARDSVAATLANYRNVEEDILYQTSTAYARLYLAQAIVQLELHNRLTLLQHLHNVVNALRNGEATRTDVAEARARLEQADARLIEARARVADAEAFYRAVVGRSPPLRLSPPVSLGPIPKTLAQARVLANENFPILQARFERRVAHHHLNEVRSGFLPRIALSASYLRAQNPEYGFTHFDAGMVSLEFSYPIYSGGATQAQERQARAEVRESQEDLHAALRTARAQVTQAWMNYMSRRAQIQAYAAQVRAERLAYRGVVVEHHVGTKTFLDVLNAEQELLTSEVDLVKARVDTVLARYRLQQRTGLLTPFSILGSQVQELSERRKTVSPSVSRRH